MGTTNFDAIQLDGQGGGTSPALVFGVGLSSDPATTATANKNFLEFRTQSTATSGDSRGIYNRLYLAGAGVSGESLRSFTTVSDVAAATAHGAVQALQHLLANSEDVTDEQLSDDTAD